jgi:hypothetical protein
MVGFITGIPRQGFNDVTESILKFILPTLRQSRLKRSRLFLH